MISEDPWIRHAQSSPCCQYLIEQKGKEYIANVGECSQSEERGDANVRILILKL